MEEVGWGGRGGGGSQRVRNGGRGGMEREVEVLRGSRPVLHPPSHCTGKDVSRCGGGGGGGEGVEGQGGRGREGDRWRSSEGHNQFFTLPLTAQIRM